MSQWSVAKTNEYSSDEDTCDYVSANGITTVTIRDLAEQEKLNEEEDDIAGKGIGFPGISQLTTGKSEESMTGKKKSIAFYVRKKLIPGSTLFFTGIFRVPEDSTSDNCFNKIKVSFNNNQANIIGLKDEDQVKAHFEAIEDDIKEETLMENEMPEECWRRIQSNSRITFTFEEARKLIKSCDSKSKKASDPTTIPTKATKTTSMKPVDQSNTPKPNSMEAVDQSNTPKPNLAKTPSKKAVDQSNTPKPNSAKTTSMKAVEQSNNPKTNSVEPGEPSNIPKTISMGEAESSDSRKNNSELKMSELLKTSKSNSESKALPNIIQTNSDDKVSDRSNFSKTNPKEIGEKPKPEEANLQFKTDEKTSASAGSDSETSAGDSASLAELKERLVFAFNEKKGGFGRQYTFDEATEKKLIEALADPVNNNTASFFMNCGVWLIPILHKENARLRDRLETVESELAATKATLKKVTDERDKKMREVFDCGTRELGEITKMKNEKEEAIKAKLKAEGTTAALKDQVKALNELMLDRKEIIVKFETMEASMKAMEEKSENTKINIDRIAASVGKEKEKKMKMWTPSVEKLSQVGTKIVFVAQENYFQTVKEFRSLGRDFERLADQGLMEKISVEGAGVILASGMSDKCAEVDWGNNSVVVLVVDGLESGSADSVAAILSMVLGPTKGRKGLVVAGPTSDKSTEEARKIILQKMEGQQVTTLNLTDTFGKVDPVSLARFEHGGRMTPLAAAYLVSMVAWWVEGIKGGEVEREDPVICEGCGCVHSDERECLKKEIPKGGDNRDGDLMENNNRRTKCQYCGGGHRDECWYKHGRGPKRIKKETGHSSR